MRWASEAGGMGRAAAESRDSGRHSGLRGGCQGCLSGQERCHRPGERWRRGPGASFSSRVAEELAAPCASKGKKGVLVLPLYWEVLGANGHSPSPGAEAGLVRGRDGAGEVVGQDP